MKNTWEPNRAIAKWLKEIKESRFAQIQTKEATYSRAAVVSESDKNIIVEFPKSTGNKEKPWKIIRNVISRDKIVSIRYYTE